MHLLEREQTLRAPLDRVFPFFADPQNLERLTPKSLSFRILTPTPIEMKAGALIDYRIALMGVPFGWRTRIDAYDPPRSFVDTQLKGPYRAWHHTHTFESRGETTYVKDHVEYEIGFGPFGAIAHVLFVRRQLQAIFDYRRTVLAEMFGEQR